MRTVLVTGADGFIGTRLVKYLAENTDWKVVPLVRGGGIPEDITDVIHLAAETRIIDAIHFPKEMIQNNVNGTLEILEHFRSNPIKGRFLLVSTVEVYGPAAAEWSKQHEWDPIVPTNPYSAGKACQEAIAISYWRTYGLPLVIANTMNIFGEGQSPEKFVPTIIHAAMTGKPCQVYIPGSRTFLHVEDFARALRFLLEADFSYLRKEPKPPRFNVVGKHETTNLAMVELVEELMGVTIEKKFIDSRDIVGFDSRYSLVGGRLAGLGFRVEHSLRDRMQQTIDWYRKNPAWLRAA